MDEQRCIVERRASWYRHSPNSIMLIASDTPRFYSLRRPRLIETRAAVATLYKGVVLCR